MEEMLLANRGCSTEMPNKSWCRSSEEGNSEFGTATKLFDRVRAGHFADVVNTGGAGDGLKGLSRALDSARALIDAAVGESVQGAQMRDDTAVDTDGGGQEGESAAAGGGNESMHETQETVANGDLKARQFLERLVVVGYVANAAYNLFGCLDKSQENVPREHQGQNRDSRRKLKPIQNVQKNIYSRGMQCDKQNDLITNNSSLNSMNTKSLNPKFMDETSTRIDIRSPQVFPNDVAMHGDSPPSSPLNVSQKPMTGLFDALQRGQAEHDAADLDMMHDADSEGGDSCSTSDDDCYEDNVLMEDVDTAIQPVVGRVAKDAVMKIEDGDAVKLANRRANMRNMRGNLNKQRGGASGDSGIVKATVRPFGHASLGAKPPIIGGISRTPEIIDGAMSIMDIMRRGNNGVAKADSGNEAEQLNVAVLALQDLAKMAQRPNKKVVGGGTASAVDIAGAGAGAGDNDTWQKETNEVATGVTSVVNNIVFTSQETLKTLSLYSQQQESVHGNSDHESETENEESDNIVIANAGQVNVKANRRSHAAVPVAAARKSILKKGSKKKLKRGKRKLRAGVALMPGESPLKKRAGVDAQIPNKNENATPIANVNAPPAKKCSKRVRFSPEVLKKDAKKAAYAEKKRFEKKSAVKVVVPKKEKAVVDHVVVRPAAAVVAPVVAACGDDIFTNAASRALVFKAIAAVMRG